jgi:hypothetical protein
MNKDDELVNKFVMNDTTYLQDKHFILTVITWKQKDHLHVKIVTNI